MWIVRLALRRPYTTAVMCLLILIMGVLSITRMARDIFPPIDIPVVAVVWSYPGMPAEEMERRVVIISERAYSTSVNGIERIESQSIPGVGLLRVYFQPGTDLGTAIAQMGATNNTILRITPPGMTPPTMLQFNASNVPVAQLTLRSETLSEQKIYDYGLQFLRIRLFTIPGLSTPAPYGGKSLQVSVDVDPQRLSGKGLSAADVMAALGNANVILPAGTARMGTKEVAVQINGSPSTVDQFKDIPVKVSGGQMVLLGDVANVSEGYADQQNVVRVNGKRATYLNILKHADASTLAVVDAAKELLPELKKAAPQGLEMKLDFDQSTFVRNAIKGVLVESLVSSILVSLMILLFLGSWRSMVIVCTSIPLAIFCGIIGLKLFGHTLNIMTLGGLALAIGMLVDDATVEVENIHRNRAMGKPLTVAILDGAAQIAVPAIVATLAICIVFFPVVLLVGPSRYLFTPLALAVVISMLASYVLSRTLVPTLSRMLMGGEHLAHGPEDYAKLPPPTNAVDRFFRWFNPRRDRALDAFTDFYAGKLAWVLHHRKAVLAFASGLAILSFGLLFVVGSDFFPTVDVGLMKLHVRAPAGTRIEETEALVERIEQRIRGIIPPDELDTVNDLIGVPVNYNLAFVPTDNLGAMDAEILIQLKEHHHPAPEYMRRIRKELAPEFPGTSLYFQSADIVSQVMNFGVSAPIDVQVESPNLAKDYEVARILEKGLKEIPGTADVRIKQVLDYPSLNVAVDRQRAARLGMSQKDVSTNLLVGLSGAGGLAPNWFLNPANGVNYAVSVKIPLRQLDSVQRLMGMPITAPGAGALLQPDSGRSPLALPQAPVETLGNVATIQPGITPNEVDHYTVQRVVDVMANVDGRDLASVIKDVRRGIGTLKGLPPNMKIRIRGQNEVMESSFRMLGLGLVLAIVLVYLLMVTLFQSWLDPFIIMMAVPGALVGILWMLALTGTTLNVESLMGSIMAVGIATSNSILLVSFANDVRVEKGMDAVSAALEAGKVRLRPVLMTALAMIIGMVPMALALGEAGEQNAPLGRAVIGGLGMATFVTLFVVPVVYSLLRVKPPTQHELEARFQQEQEGAQA